MKNTILATISILFIFSIPQANSSSLDETFIKHFINKATSRNIASAKRVATSTCTKGMQLIAGTIFETHKGGDIAKQADQLGLILAIVQYVDPRTYKTLRNALIKGETDPLTNLFDFESAATLPCNNAYTLQEVLLSNI